MARKGDLQAVTHLNIGLDNEMGEAAQRIGDQIRAHLDAGSEIRLETVSRNRCATCGGYGWCLRVGSCR